MNQKRINKIKNNHAKSAEIFRDKTLLIVNTGSFKKRFVFQKLKKLGLKLIVLNKEKNWAQQYVDHWILADNYNHNESLHALRQFLSKNPEIKINGAVTFWEDDVLLTSKITDKFNLTGIPFSIAKKVRNKYLFRDFCRENNIPAPKYKLIKTAKDLNFVKKNFYFPVVIKPVYGAGSAFVVKVEDENDLDKIYEQVCSNLSPQVESALNDGLDVMAEEFIEGEEVDVDMLLQNGKVKFYAVSDNFNKEKGIFFLDRGQATPSNLPDKNQEQLLEMAEDTLEKLGIQNGCIHFEAKSTKNGPVPLEVNLRMGGDYVYSYLKSAWGVDLVENTIKIALDEYFKLPNIQSPKKYIIGWDLYPGDSGVLVQLDISAKLKKKKYFENLHFYKKTGDPVLLPPDGYDYIGWLTVSGENALDVQDNLKEALEFIKFTVVKFDPASSVGKTSRRSRFSFASLRKARILQAAKIENIRHVSKKNLKNLHVGIACNLFSKEDGTVEDDLTSVGKNIEKTLSERGYRTTFLDFNNIPRVLNDLTTSNVDIVFNVCERINNSSLLEPHGASILDVFQIPYTGSNPFTLALCIDKIRVKKLLAFHDIPTPKWDYAYSMDDEIDDELKFPLIVKPGNTDNSIGITNESVVTNKKQLERQLEKVIVGLGRPALVEEYIEGDEYDVSVLGSDENDLKVLPLSRSIFSEMPEGFWHIYPFDAKWGHGTPYDKIIVQRPPKNISKKLTSLISEIALDTYNILDCHDYGRVEVRVDRDNNPYVLELNPNPSINMGDCVPVQAGLIGLDYGDFLEEILRLAITRYKNKPPYYHLQGNLL